MLKQKVLLLILVLVLLLTAFAEFGRSDAQASFDASLASATKDTLIVAIGSEPATLDPYAHSKQEGFTTTTLIFETLVKKDKNGEFIPWLATEWNFVDDTTVIFKLRDDVTFHDGNKLTAEDVRFSLTYGAESSFSKNLFGSIDVENTKAIDETTFELKLLQPYAPLLEALSSFRAGIISKAAHESMGTEAFGRAPVGTGPMKFTNWVSGDRMEMDAFADYWGDPLPFKKTIIRIISEASARSIELETGGVDIAFDVSFSDWIRLDENPDTKLVSGQSQSFTFLLLNNSIEPFNDVRVRKALAYGLDMNALVKIAWQGQAEPADTFYSKNILGHKTEGPMEYNPEKAKELLTEAGYPEGLTIQYYTHETQVNTAIAEIVENMWGQIGVKVKINIVDLATITSMNNAGEVTVSHMATPAAIADPDAALLIWPIYRTISVRHNDQKVQDFLDAGKATYVESERSTIYQELQDYLWEQMYVIPVAFPKAAFGTQRNISLDFAPSLVPDLTQVIITE